MRTTHASKEPPVILENSEENVKHFLPLQEINQTHTDTLLQIYLLLKTVFSIIILGTGYPVT